MEVIGSTASVFALYQLCASIKDLVDFGKAVLDAPTTVKALFEDLELLELVVAQARGVAHLLTFDDTTERVLRCCESKISILHHKLAKPISRFQSGNFIQRKWSALKITLRVEDIKDLQQSIQDAKSTLQIPQTNRLLTCFASLEVRYHSTSAGVESELLYRMVCSDKCEDGICVAWVFEDGALDQPFFPAHLWEDPNIVESSKEGDNFEPPTSTMPGAFID